MSIRFQDNQQVRELDDEIPPENQRKIKRNLKNKRERINKIIESSMLDTSKTILEKEKNQEVMILQLKKDINQ